MGKLPLWDLHFYLQAVISVLSSAREVSFSTRVHLYKRKQSAGGTETQNNLKQSRFTVCANYHKKLWFSITSIHFNLLLLQILQNIVFIT